MEKLCAPMVLGTGFLGKHSGILFEFGGELKKLKVTKKCSKELESLFDWATLHSSHRPTLCFFYTGSVKETKD